MTNVEKERWRQYAGAAINGLLASGQHPIDRTSKPEGLANDPAHGMVVWAAHIADLMLIEDQARPVTGGGP